MSKVWREKIVINDKIFVVPIVVGVGVTTKVFYPTLKMLTPPRTSKKNGRFNIIKFLIWHIIIFKLFIFFPVENSIT